MTFKEGKIHDVVIRDLKKFVDDRGWLSELFREDEIDRQFMPVMSYISVTRPGIARGPHEHTDQVDLFAFIGPSNFKVYLWDGRRNSPSYLCKCSFIAGEEAPKSVIIPPGVVHAYKNIGAKDGTVINLPNRLYAGKGKKDPVDEIRHENRTEAIYQLD
jgi:dTDP-4-dehydrorhamnose 3,5-epimerase